MGRKNVVKQFKMLDGSEDFSANVVSSETNVINQDIASIHIAWSNGAALNSEIRIEAQNNEKDDDWYELDMGGTISLSGVSGDHQLVFLQMPFNKIRIQYLHTAGDADVVATITSKVVGA